MGAKLNNTVANELRLLCKPDVPNIFRSIQAECDGTRLEMVAHWSALTESLVLKNVFYDGTDAQVTSLFETLECLCAEVGIGASLVIDRPGLQLRSVLENMRFTRVQSRRDQSISYMKSRTNCSIDSSLRNKAK